VAFLFTDLEGSTNLARTRPDEYAELLKRHQSILRESFAHHDGYEVGTEGDSFFVVFSSPLSALRAAVEGQRALAVQEWPAGTDVRVRMGLHVGEASLRDGDYIGLDIHRAARLAAAGHGGQVLASAAVVEVLADRLPPELGFRDLGKHRLKDFDLPASIFQVTGDGLEPNFPALRTPAAANLPEQLTSFIGRERELAELAGLLEHHRLVTLIGTGGSGKTRLMLEAATHVLDRHGDGVWLVELAPIADADQVDDEVARTLGIHIEPGKAVLDSLIDFLRSKSLLLLLDNCEHVVGSVALLVLDLVRASPGLTIFASSREALGIPGEVVFQVPSLGLPGPATVLEPQETAVQPLQAVADTEAVRLFVDRATSVLPSFELTPANAAAVVEICRRLDGIPLAIELAAARVTVLSVEEIAERLGDRFRLLRGGRRAAVPRQQTLQALIDWSWDLLEEADKRLLRRLAVFAGGCTLDYAAAVSGPVTEARGNVPTGGAGDETGFETLEGLNRLVDRSLVVVDRTAPTRYRLLETIRQYAQDRLDEAQETAEVRSRHLGFFLRLALQAQPELRGPDMVVWLDRLDADADNLRTALEWAFETDTDAALRLSSAMALYWRSRFVGSEEVERLGRAAGIVLASPVTGPDISPEKAALAARVLAAAAEAAALWGNPAMASEWAEEAVGRARRAEGQEGLVEALSARALAAVFLGLGEEARSAGDEIVELARSRQDWWLLAMTETGLALSDLNTGGPEPAEARIVSATEAARRSGNPFAIAFTANTRGQLSGLIGRVDDARHWFEEAIQAYERMGDRRFALMARSDLAHALRRTGATSEAEEVYRQTLPAWQHAGTRGAIANQLECFAFLALAGGSTVRAARLFGAAETVREAAGANMLPHERAEYEAAQATLRGRLDAAALGGAWSEGRKLTLEEAIAFALAP
jgi:predicted ATPase/class 3 adenylate cyclase